MKNKILILVMGAFMATVILPACKAKSCDTANNIDGDQGSRKGRKKNLGLFSKKELRKKKWR